ncbi:pyridoxal kinase-like [Babylonia areolata]|uniref:pyridoxal kinase-like n=1 Tax=Babylonia areolata TaxID=304850 RepID=UPI003FD36B48
MAGRCERRVLSIQSSVVWGYVGNKTAVFPLQVHGFDVSPINTVQFSNHTEYGHFKGQVLNDDDLSELVSGLRTNQLLRFSHVLTGYIGSKSFLEKVADVVKELRANNDSIVYVCDPVMGDDGHMYVPEDLVQPYKDVIVPLADILTPNQYELELLTDRRVRTEGEALAAMEHLHQKGVGTVVLSSSHLDGGHHGDHLLALASSSTDGVREVYRLVIPRVEATFVGTGDLFACSLLTWLHKDRNNIKSALEKTVATVQAVMARTLAFAKENTEPGEKPGMAAMELQLVQSKADIENPTVTIQASKVPVDKQATTK